MPIVGDIRFYKGEDILLTVTMSPVVNVSGWMFTFTMRDAANTIILQKLNSAFTIVDGPGGIFSFVIASIDTSALTAGYYSYDIQRVDTGHQTVLRIGTLNLVDEVFNP